MLNLALIPLLFTAVYATPKQKPHRTITWYKVGGSAVWSLSHYKNPNDHKIILAKSGKSDDLEPVDELNLKITSGQTISLPQCGQGICCGETVVVAVHKANFDPRLKWIADQAWRLDESKAKLVAIRDRVECTWKEAATSGKSQ